MTSNVAGRASNGHFALRRVIQIRHRGNLANKMLQYMGALTLANRIKDCTIVNVSLPEWGIEIPDDTQEECFFDDVDLWTWDPFRPHVEELTAIANRSQSIRIILGDHLLRMEFLMTPTFYNQIFPERTCPSQKLSDTDLLINIRSAELLNGVPHYPLLPIDFYEDVVTATGLNPVFMGQLQPSEYVRLLRQRFPKAQFIESQGAIADFNMIRAAKNIVVAVSTFSWLAAWLSDARTIILPLNGFFNPAHHREVDLLPVDDIRYRFFLFPLNYGLSEQDSLAHHQRMRRYWKEVSRNQVALLKSAAPFLRPPRETYDNGLPSRMARGSSIMFDPVWYAHRYVDAAMEISEGWFEDPLHHYLEAGRLRGYLPTRPIGDGVPLDTTLPNIALNKPATQSSLSRWSKGSTLEQDAGNAVSGIPSKDYGFCTNNDPIPWWMVDLEAPAQVHFIRIFNRDTLELRASPLIVETSTDSERWSLLFSTPPGHLFGGYKRGRPLVWSTKDPAKVRYVRISVPRPEHLHLAEVEIYGRFNEDSDRSLTAAETGLAEFSAQFLKPEYNGDITGLARPVIPPIRPFTSVCGWLQCEIPVLVPCFNNPTYARSMLRQLRKLGFERVILVDNASTSPDMRAWLAGIYNDATIIMLTENLGPRHAILDPRTFALLPQKFCVTDPDLVFNPALPDGFLGDLAMLIDRHKVGKAGFALDISDREKMIDKLYSVGNEGQLYKIWDWEAQFWRKPLEELEGGDRVYSAAIDTTFALYDKAHFDPANFYRAVRVAGRFTARHLPWYRDFGLPEAEAGYYRSTQKWSSYITDR